MEEDKELPPLFELDLEILHQPSLPDFDMYFYRDLKERNKNSNLLYPKSKNEDILNTSLQPLYFEWNNFKQCFSNLSVDVETNRLELRPILPWQLLEEDTFQKFLKENDKNIIAVLRIGFEVIFGTFLDIDDLDDKIILWLNHHIYDTSACIDVHDFDKEGNRRIRNFNVKIIPYEKEPRVLWKNGFYCDED
jgi:hypothetical protein